MSLILLHVLDFTESVPHFYCTPSIVLSICVDFTVQYILDFTAHPQFYCTYSIQGEEK